MEAGIRLLLVEDNPSMRSALRRMLDASPDFEVVGEAEETEEAVRLASELEPDLVLMDLRIPGAGGIDATRRIRRRQPDTVVVGWSAYSDREFVRGMIGAGAAGYLLKGTQGDVLLSSLRALTEGATPLAMALPPQFIHAPWEEDPDGSGPGNRTPPEVGTERLDRLVFLLRELPEPVEVLRTLAASLDDPAVRASEAGERAAGALVREVRRVAFLAEDLMALSGIADGTHRGAPGREPGGPGPADPDDTGHRERSLLRIAGRVVEAVGATNPRVRLVPAVRPETASTHLPPWEMFAIWRRLAALAVRGREEGRGILGADETDEGLLLSVVLQHMAPPRSIEPDDVEVGSLRSLVEGAGGEVREIDLRAPTRIHVVLPLPPEGRSWVSSAEEEPGDREAGRAERGRAAPSDLTGSGPS
ncbi:MAG: response regulator transcription factor [Actinobacteria bacterium]|nr:response regulator transcription factor [Actinomycetota bacterium]